MITYRVLWRIAGYKRRHTDDCLVDQDYTTFADIPRMLAIKYGLKVEQVHIIGAVEIKE